MKNFIHWVVGQRDEHGLDVDLTPLEYEFEKEALLPEIQRRLVEDLDADGAAALADGVSPAGRIFLAGFAQGFTAGMDALSRHLERMKEK